MDYQFDFSVIWENWQYLAQGMSIAALVTLLSLLFSLPVGILVALCRLSEKSWLWRPAAYYVMVFRNTPTLVQLIWVYYCLPILLGVDLSAINASILALSLGTGAYMAEIFRAGIQSIDTGQFEAARTVGLSYVQTMQKVVLPQALRRVIPPTVNEIVTLIKHSSLVSILGVADLTYQAQVLASTSFRPIEVFTFLGIEYLIICALISLLAGVVERRLAVSGAR